MQNQTKRFRNILLLIVACVCINLAGNSLASLFPATLYLDSLGTILGAALGGYLPGVIIGLISNLIKAIYDPASIYYASLNVLIALAAAALAKRGFFKKIRLIPVAVILLALLGGAIGSVFTWFLYEFSPDSIGVPFIADLYASGKINSFFAALCSDYLQDLLDKAITVSVAAVILHFIPESIYSEFRIRTWRQAPLDEETEKQVRNHKTRKTSIRAKILAIIITAMSIVSVAAVAICARLYMNSSISEHTILGRGIASLAANAIDAERVDDFLEEGEQAEGYKEIEEELYRIRDTSPSIEYLYVYRIEEDGCHVVFDLDTEDTPGGEPGDLIPFDESFADYIPDLLAGKEIDPIISNDTYGWLLTAYKPVYDHNGNCVCYAAADISMGQIRMTAGSYVMKMISLFTGFFILVVVFVLWFTEYNIVMPINTMSHVANSFAVGSESSRRASLEQIRSLDIRTGDEIEDLYRSFGKTTSDCIDYADESRRKTEMISEMQNGLISVLAEVVESRDQYTGNHVRNTALYAQLIMNEMVKEGIYADQMNEEFMKEVVYSAPLHDVGKIKVPDAILNKPGRLTDDEFSMMKEHTTMGSEIIDQAIDIVPDPLYLKETKNLSMYHHEKWDGSGYPEGLKGEEIPLSARIMAVADVFDALVSKRSYKEGMPCETAFKIIEEGSGSHFDPKIAQAFLNCKEEAAAIAMMGKDEHPVKG